MWINSTCHSYLLPQFEVNPMFVPTVVFYLPEKDKSAHLIGKFDKATILKHQEKFVSGKLPTFPMKTKARDIEIKDLDCPNLKPEIEITEDSQDKDLEDEILKEILREDEERRKKREKEEADMKKRGGKGKKKKKDKKKGNKEDL
jgi:hypothetical protein